MAKIDERTLLLFIDSQPGDDRGVMFGFEPAWHVREPGRVLTGSIDTQFEDEDPEAEERIRRLESLLGALLGRTVEDVAVEPETFDLTLALSGGYVVKTFVADATDEETWRIQDNASGSVLSGSPEGLSVL
ncbi:MAG TPA: hypothetical protein VF789_08435 [Thermoanaerobaculia bacterium]